MINKDPAYLDYVNKAAAHLEEIRTKEKTDPETQMNRKGLDGVYAYIATMARLGHLTGEQHYFDFCVELVRETELFYEPASKLLNHGNHGYKVVRIAEIKSSPLDYFTVSYCNFFRYGDHILPCFRIVS